MQWSSIQEQFDVVIIETGFHTLSLDVIDGFLQGVRLQITGPDQIVLFWSTGHPVDFCDYDVIRHLNQFADSVTNPVIFCTGCLGKVDPVAPVNFKISNLSYFEFLSMTAWNRSWRGRINLKSGLRNKKFLSMGTKDYPQRKYILGSIIKHDLLDQGYVSYSQHNSGTLPGSYTQDEIDTVMQLANLVDPYLPMPTLDDSIEWDRMPRHFMTNSYVNIITDTFYHNIRRDCTFISEKVFNAMAHGQMFVMLSPPGTLRYLQQQGYHTFDSVIDEGYDSIDNPCERMVAMTKSFIDFVDRPQEQIHADYVRCFDIIKHNQDRLYATSFLQDLARHIQEAKDEKI
jgi:hypothetical protein